MLPILDMQHRFGKDTAASGGHDQMSVSNRPTFRKVPIQILGDQSLNGV